MNNLNTSEIKRQAWTALKQNPSIIMTFLILVIASAVASGALCLIPVVGVFAALFVTSILQGIMMMEIEEKALGEDESIISNYGAFGSVVLTLVIAFISFIGIAGVIFLGPIFSALTNHDTSTVVRWIVILNIIILVGSILLSIWNILPKIYIASKYNDCSYQERKEIMNTFKENGLFQRSFLLELSIFGEVILLYILTVAVISVLIRINLLLLILIVYLAFIVAMFAISIKTVIARVILYRELSDKTEN